MKKIVVCIALAIISMMSAAASFLVNDAPAYRNWAQVNRPKIIETFGRDKKEKLGKIPPPAARPRKEEQRAYDESVPSKNGRQRPSPECARQSRPAG